MPEDFLQSKLYASTIEERIRKKKKVDLQEWDFHGFIEQLKHSTTGVAEEIKAPETLMKKITEAGSFLGTLQLTQEKAALSGSFTPADLFSSRVKAKEKKDVLTALASFCSITKSGGIKWQLNKQKRTEILQQLIAENRLLPLLQGSLPLTNAFGKMLRKLLEEQDHLAINKISQTALLTLVNVLETLEEVNFPKPSLAELRGKIIAKQMLDEYTAISADFIGREAELKALYDFLDMKQANTGNQAKIMTGMGGVGKSTLIAKFVREILDTDAATVAILDFDRPGISVEDQVWMAEEILRQLSEQNPGLREEQLKDIASIKQGDDRYLQKSITSDKFEGQGVSQRLLSLVGNGIHIAGKQDKPFLLILDTLEEVAQNSASSQLFEWVNMVVDLLYPIRIRIIFSGRLFEEQLAEFQRLSYVINEPMEVNQFDEVIAARFLHKQGLTRALSEKIAGSKLLPLRPLELKLMARVLKSGELSFDALKRELSKKSNKGQELFAGIIYRRVLMRIPDKDVRAIAYPGLILRYITPELVRQVLQPALGLKEMTITEAEQTVKKLAKFSWLTYKTGHDQLWHRKDLRRSMLKLMISQQPAKAESIRENAILYFQSGKTAEDKSEELYHRLMGVRSPKDGEHLELNQLKSAYRALQADSADLPEPARVLLDYAFNIDLSPAELPLLPVKYFAKAYDRIGRQLLTSRKFRLAYQLYIKGKRVNKYHGNDIVTHNKEEDLLANWENETMYATAEWKELEKRPNTHDYSFEASLTNVVSYVFPFSLTHIKKIDPKFLESILKGAANQRMVTGRGTSASTTQSMLQRLAICMVLLKKNRKLSPGSLKALKAILLKLETQTMAPITKNSLLLLNLVANDRPVGQYVPDASSVCFDLPLLKQLNIFHSADIKKIVHKIEGRYAGLRSRSITISKFTSEFYADFSPLTEKKTPAWFTIDKLGRRQAYELLKGPDIIFITPLTYALADAFKTPKDWRLLSEILRDLVPANIQDFHYEKMLSALQDNKDLAIERYVEFIDRFWRIGDLVTMAAKLKPANAKLKAVLTSYRAWQKALQTLFMR